MAGPPRRGHPAACLERANRIGPAAPAGGRNAVRPCQPSGFLGPRRLACRPGAAPSGRSRTRATGSSGRASQRGPQGQSRRTGMRREPVAVMSEAIRPAKPTGKSMRHAAGRPKGAWALVRRPGALCGAFDDRGQDPGTGTVHARQHLPACQRAPDGRGQRRQGGAG